MIQLVYKVIIHEKTDLEKLYRRLVKMVLEVDEIVRVVMASVGFAAKNVAAVVESGHSMIVVISF